MKPTSQQGFTLIELVVVIVILGILAATALPKFIDLKGDAAAAAVSGAAGALSSAASINYGAAMVKNANSTAVTGCADLTKLLTTWDSAKFSMAGAGSCSGTAGATVTCEVQSKDDTTKTASATAICTG